MSNKTSYPLLYETVHYRRLRESMTELMKITGIPASKYNLYNCRCYSTTGNSLMGANVKFSGIPSDRSCFVDDNSYEVYEFPSATNSSRFMGEFLVLFYNRSFNYYILAIANYKSGYKRTYEFNIHYRPLMEFTMTNTKGVVRISKSNHGAYLSEGRRKTYGLADADWARRISYGYYQSNVNDLKESHSTISKDNSRVKIYKKKKFKN